MYPTIVIALVYSQCSIVDTYDLRVSSTISSRPSRAATPEQDKPHAKSETGANVSAVRDLEKVNVKSASNLDYSIVRSMLTTYTRIFRRTV